MSTTKAIKGERKRERERERKWEREIEIEHRARTKHNISKFPNSQNPKAEIETQTDYPALKNSFHKRVRHNKREREREIEIEPSALDWNSKARTKHISKFPNSLNPKAEIETQTDYLALKNNIHDREIERTFTICLSQTRSCSEIETEATVTLKLSG